MRLSRIGLLSSFLSLLAWSQQAKAPRLGLDAPTMGYLSVALRVCDGAVRQEATGVRV